jgi:SAM-dependent methyltransferase
MYNTEEEYRKDFRDSIYLAAWAQAYRFIRQIPEAKILEVGCGSGQFASFLHFLGFRNYFRGFDLSNQAIEIAKGRVEFLFAQGDAYHPKEYEGDYNTIVSLEALEHIPDDLAVLKNIPAGKFLVISLPDFEYESHYRWFTNARQIETRYYRYIDIQKIVKVEKWFMVYGKAEPITPSLAQKLFRTRGRVNGAFFWHRYIKPFTTFFVKPLVRAIFSR